MTFESLSPVSTHAALYAHLQQEALERLTDTLGEYRWDVDTTAGILTFTSPVDPSRSIVAGCEVIASIAPGPRSMLWGWSMEQGRADGFAAKIRSYGAQHGIAELTAPEVFFPTDPIDDLASWVLGASHQVGAVATAVTGHGPYFSAPFGGGSRAVCMLTLNPPLPKPTVSEAVVALPRLLSGLPLTDPRQAVLGLARLSGWSAEWTDAQYTHLTVDDNVSKATIEFDEQGRVVRVQGSLSA
ncbi:hypothetical protein G7067_09715 [Leucobacter insecticola]|uniref:Uncharacterized protein n=1 Tax=Leucobacter insecticola TaxID=2714934 RepID=A0A6G8FJU3_9MICO|nr:DUF6882 domain-containing protein [Leucobacter insecticola]QIM16621.1 hypothetical protein G7067_09715 [Leucobacter insecticola]